MRAGLPVLVHKENRLRVGLLLFVAGSILYLAPNHFHIFRVHFLPLSPIDTAMPFIPQTIWLYVSEYFYVMVIYFSYREMSNLNRAIYAFLALQVICVSIFWLWPTVIARDTFPVPPTLGPLTSAVLTALRRADTPANCFPSFHVASVYLACFLLSSEVRWKFRFFLVWATAIAVSTLTTKQHYFADVVSGFALAVVLYYVFRNARIESAPATPQIASAMRTGSSN